MGYIYCSIQQFPLYFEAFEKNFKCYSRPVLVLYNQGQPKQWSVFPKHAVDYIFFFYRGITQAVCFFYLINFFFSSSHFYFYSGYTTVNKPQRNILWGKLEKLVSWEKMPFFRGIFFGFYYFFSNF